MAYAVNMHRRRENVAFAEKTWTAREIESRLRLGKSRAAALRDLSATYSNREDDKRSETKADINEAKVILCGMEGKERTKSKLANTHKAKSKIK